MLLVADGLVPHLTEAEARRLLTSVVSALVQFDTVSVWARRTAKWDPTLRRYGTRFHCGFDDPAAPAEWHPRLEFVDEAPMNDSPVLMAKAPATMRRAYRLLNLVPGLKRSTRIARSRFWPVRPCASHGSWPSASSPDRAPAGWVRRSTVTVSHRLRTGDCS